MPGHPGDRADAARLCRRPGPRRPGGHGRLHRKRRAAAGAGAIHPAVRRDFNSIQEIDSEPQTNHDSTPIRPGLAARAGHPDRLHLPLRAVLRHLWLARQESDDLRVHGHVDDLPLELDDAPDLRHLRRQPVLRARQRRRGPVRQGQSAAPAGAAGGGHLHARHAAGVPGARDARPVPGHVLRLRAALLRRPVRLRRQLRLDGAAPVVPADPVRLQRRPVPALPLAEGRLGRASAGGPEPLPGRAGGDLLAGGAGHAAAGRHRPAQPAGRPQLGRVEPAALHPVLRVRLHRHRRRRRAEDDPAPALVVAGCRRGRWWVCSQS